MITPRTTRLLRVRDLQQFRNLLVDLSTEGESFSARDRIVVVPTHTASVHLRRTIEQRCFAKKKAIIFPEFVTRNQLIECFASRLTAISRALTIFEREVLMGVACRSVEQGGTVPPFQLRSGLVAEILKFYDSLQRCLANVETFERLLLSTLQSKISIDRGAERLARQTKFLAAVFVEFEQLCLNTGALDEHMVRRIILEQPTRKPWNHVILAVRDNAAEPGGLWSSDYDLLSRVPGLKKLDVVVTENCLSGNLHHRLHEQLPGIEEIRISTDSSEKKNPSIATKEGLLVQTSRDREEEVSNFSRWVKQLARETPHSIHLDHIGLVVPRPLPYVYVAQTVLRSASIPSQMFEALPLAAEPYAAALDLVLTFATSGYSRTSAIRLLRSPHFHFNYDGNPVDPLSVDALNLALQETNYLGGFSTLESIVKSWETTNNTNSVCASPIPAGKLVLNLAKQLLPITEPAAPAAHLDVLLQFLTRNSAVPISSDDLQTRHLRVRVLVISVLTALRNAYSLYDEHPNNFIELDRTIRRWIESHTFSPRRDQAGVCLVDAESAAFRNFNSVQLAGLIDGEWPSRPRRNIFYPPGLLRELGWFSERDRIDGARALFRDLLRLPTKNLVVSNFSLEDDTIVSGSPFLDELETIGFPTVEESSTSSPRIFEIEALTLEPTCVQEISADAREWIDLRLQIDSSNLAYHGSIQGYSATAYSPSALERYQDCPFKFFASEVLKIEEPPEDHLIMSRRERGRFIHEVLQRFFEAWDQRGIKVITPERVGEARDLFAKISKPLLDRLPKAEAAIERMHLFGSAVAMGIVDRIITVETLRPNEVQARLLEYTLKGTFTLGADDGRTVPLRGVADRIDLLNGSRLRVIDYKSGNPPILSRALQVPVYALCAAERLKERDGKAWAVDTAAYVAFGQREPFSPVVSVEKTDTEKSLFEARNRVFAVIDNIEQGVFPPSPFKKSLCRSCAFTAVCRKDYVS